MLTFLFYYKNNKSIIERMKVLIVFNHPAPYKVNLFNEIAKYVDLDVIFERTEASDRPKDFYSENNIQFNAKFFNKCYLGAENTYTNEVRKYIKENHSKYDLIIMNGYSTFAEMKAISFMNKRKIPFGLYINGGVVKKESFIKRRIKTKYISSASYYFSPCKEANDYLVYYGAKENKIYTYPYSTFFEKDVLSRPLTKGEKALLRKQYDLPDNKIFVSASQFIERKNILQLLRVFKDREETLLLIGSGPQKDEYIKYIKDNNMQNVIIRDFMKKEDLMSLLPCCDFFITLSLQDIYGHTTNEAMAKGLPVISSKNVVSSLHLIENGVNGYLVDLNDEDIISSIEKINVNMANAALRTAKENTIEAMAEAHKIIFERIMEK